MGAYEKVYSNNINLRKQGLVQLQVWKIRHGTETPASILSTNEILDVQLKDELGEISSKVDLKSMYSGAFTRFLNYIASIEHRNEKKRTLYSIANQLGIESFLVDLRHLCSHGKEIPSLEIFRRAAAYCMNWLKAYYWNREMQFIQDVDVTTLKINNTIRFERNLNRLFLIYDGITEAIHLRCENIEELFKIVTDTQRKELIEEYFVQLYDYRLDKIFNCIVCDIMMASKAKALKERAHIISEQLLQCPYFVKSTKIFNERTDNHLPLTKVHTKLYYEIQKEGLMFQFFAKLVYKSEDSFENDSVRFAAAFWVDKILEGFLIYQENYPYLRLDSYATLQELSICESRTYSKLIEHCKQMNENADYILILKNWFYNPLNLNISHEFIQKRIENISEFTKQYICRLIEICKFANLQTQNQYQKILELFTIFNSTLDMKATNNMKTLQLFTLDEDLLSLHDQKLNLIKNHGYIEKLEKYDWKSCPLGAIL